jgi:hypothetical protein
VAAVINSAYGRQEEDQEEAAQAEADQAEAAQAEADQVKTYPQEVNGSKEADPQREKKEGDEKAGYSPQGDSEKASSEIAQT